MLDSAVSGAYDGRGAAGCWDDDSAADAEGARWCCETTFWRKTETTKTRSAQTSRRSYTGYEGNNGNAAKEMGVK